MLGPVLYDAVTLRHFAIAGRLDVLETRHTGRPPPRWTDAVRGEVQEAAKGGASECAGVLAATWLGDPIAPRTSDLKALSHLHAGLNLGVRPATEHLGEAESIYFAEKLGGTFVTDDNAAYDFAERRFGHAYVLDSVDILREAVAMDELGSREALEIAEAIRSRGRFLRRIHPESLSAGYFRV